MLETTVVACGAQLKDLDKHWKHEHVPFSPLRPGKLNHTRPQTLNMFCFTGQICILSDFFKKIQQYKHLWK